MSDTITVTCPHCQTALVIDLSAGVVVDHSVPARTAEKIDFDARLQQLQRDKARSEDRLAEAMRQEKDKDRLMEDKFRSLMKKAKDDDGSRPLRDIDLD
jgi:hypothetical protein